jgi:hypothetical protein
LVVSTTGGRSLLSDAGRFGTTLTLSRLAGYRAHPIQRVTRW